MTRHVWCRFKGTLLVLVALAAGVADAAERRLALVIGNAAYRDAPLDNPINDARAMASALRDLGFEVVLQENATKTAMEDAIGHFGLALDDRTVALVFYAGHGIQVNGRNFLIPVDASIQAESQIRLAAIDVDILIDQMALAGSRVKILILDACRNNPFERQFRRGGQGLAQISAPSGTLIAYATAPGSVAADGDRENGLYTGELLNAIRQPGLSIEQVFKQVRVQVSAQSKGKQVPWESSSLVGEFRFLPDSATPPIPTAPAATGAASAELLFWQSIMESSRAADFAAYLEAYPDGIFAPLARNRITALSTAVANQTPVTATDPVPFPDATDRGPEPADDATPAIAPPAFPEPDWQRLLDLEQHDRHITAKRLQRAARRGNLRAQVALAVMLDQGLGVPADPAAALRLYRSAALRGHALAQLGLATLYRQGRGTRRNTTEAATWFRRAADQGHPLGQTALAFLYRDGVGVARDLAEAVRLFTLAAGRGVALSQAALAWHIEFGQGIAADAARARALYESAARAGNAYAREQLRRLASR